MSGDATGIVRARHAAPCAAHQRHQLGRRGVAQLPGVLLARKHLVDGEVDRREGEQPADAGGRPLPERRDAVRPDELADERPDADPLARKKVLGWPKRRKLAHTFLWGCGYKKLKLAQLLGQLGVFLAWAAPVMSCVFTRSSGFVSQPATPPAT